MDRNAISYTYLLFQYYFHKKSLLHLRTLAVYCTRTWKAEFFLSDSEDKRRMQV